MGGFIVFLRGKEKRSEGDGDQSIIGDIPIRSSPKHYSRGGGGGGDSLIKVDTDVRAQALDISEVNFCSGIGF